jgi:hypothetical protein
LTTTLSVLVLVLGPLSALLAPVRAVAQEEITCADFVRQEAAQALLEADGDYAATLDPDGDGIACNETEGAEEESAGGSEGTEDVGEDQATPVAGEEAAGGEQPTMTNPLRGRFGSNREQFEELYGRPYNDDKAEIYPIGLLYRVDGFNRVYAFYHRDYVAYLTLIALEDEPWTQSEAEERAKQFLPVDWEQAGEPIEVDDGDLLIPGHSVALAGRFSADTYERYGAQGEQGDVYFLLRLAGGNEVTAIEIGLGNDVQSPPDQAGGEAEGRNQVGDAGEEVDPEEYLADVRRQFDILTASVEEFGAIITDPNFTTDQALFDRLIQILVIWASASVDAQSLTPPDEYQDLHEAFLEYTALLSGAATDLTVGLSSGETASIQAGGQKLEAAIELQPSIEAMLTEAGV